MRRLPVIRHRTAGQAWAEYRACRRPVEKARWHLVWLLLRADEPQTPAQAAAAVGVSVVTARTVLERCNADGPAGLAGRQPRSPATDRRSAGRPGHRLEEAAAGWRAVDRAEGGRVRPRPVGGPGRPAVRVAVAGGPRVHPPGAPTRPPPGGRPGRPTAVGKNLKRRLAQVRRANPGRRFAVWAEDEARLGSSRSPAGSGRSGAGGRGPVGGPGPIGCAGTGSPGAGPARRSASCCRG